MGNPYATENFLRKQCRLRDERIRDLELALRGLVEQLDGIGIPDWHGAEGLDLSQARAALQPTPKDIVAC